MVKLALSPEDEVVLLAKLAKYVDEMMKMVMVVMMMVTVMMMMATMMISTLSPEAVVVLLAKLQPARARVRPPPLLRSFQFQFLATTPAAISSGQLRLENCKQRHFSSESRSLVFLVSFCQRVNAKRNWDLGNIGYVSK